MMMPNEIFALLGTEIAYSFVIAAICIIIYLKTREIYKLSEHSGIFHFRNIFLYFSLSYVFRLVYIISFFFFDARFRGPFTPNIFLMILVSYFSTMAIMSIAITIISRSVNIGNQNLNSAMHIISIFLTFSVFIMRSFDVLIILQTAIFVASILLMLSKKPIRNSRLSNQNRIIFLLLFVFWIINIFSTGRPDLLLINIVIYLISLGIFLSIYLRVNKRLVKNGKKKK